MTNYQYDDEEELDEDAEPEEGENDPYESPLAKEFAAMCEDIGAQINAHVEAASKELRKAIALSEKHGVPFLPNISFLRNSYMPSSFFDSKFAELDQEVVCEIANVRGDYLFDGGGWQHSAVC
jgi:hypothetical protein